MEFSEESKLLIEHWDSFQDAMRAYEKLQDEELPAILQSIMAEIEEAAWSEGWKLVERHPRRFYLFNPDWVVRDDKVLRISLRDFRPRKLFGVDEPPELQVRVSLDYPELTERLLDELEERDKLLGTPIRSQSQRTAITEAVQKCPPGSSDGYAEAVKKQALRFFEHYATVLLELDDIIQEELARERQSGRTGNDAS